MFLAGTPKQHQWKEPLENNPENIPSDPLFKRVFPSPSIIIHSPAPQPAQGLRYSHKFFTFELTEAELIGDEVKLTFLYTNRQETSNRGWLETNITRTYLIDNLGNRYQHTGSSFVGERDFPPEVSERIWVTFGKLRAGAASVSLFMNWRYNTPGWYGHSENVVIRNFPLPR